ncbi:MAG: shikimate dehydrogenase [Fusicatenibacter sp.]|nr:shikimate dehydrogenase [Lachnospiraceae bacterium]MDY2939268.1 shikimate dehydrogenase [Fusicatenibacter sp.]
MIIQDIPITGHTVLTGLLGSPVAHSISPLMHNEAFRLLGLDYIYLCFDVTEETLPEAVAGLKAMGARGFNLTMPNKNRVVELLDEISPAARLTKAVNTVVNENGRLIGTTTDGVGYMQSVIDAGYDIIGKNMTLMGGGGAASAICAQAALDGVQELNIFIRPTSRFYPRMKELTDAINETTSCHASLYDHADTSSLRSCLNQSAILVNATSVGMAPDVNHSIIEDTTLFHEGLIVSDLIYNPRKTRLLSLAEQSGCKIFNGMYMLLYQGAEAFRIWTGQDMPVEPIKQLYFSDRT